MSLFNKDEDSAACRITWSSCFLLKFVDVSHRRILARSSLQRCFVGILSFTALLKSWHKSVPRSFYFFRRSSHLTLEYFGLRWSSRSTRWWQVALVLWLKSNRKSRLLDCCVWQSVWGVSVDMLCVGFARGGALWPNVHFGFICPQDIVPDANLSHAATFLLGKEKIVFQALLIQLF